MFSHRMRSPPALVFDNMLCCYLLLVSAPYCITTIDTVELRIACQYVKEREINPSTFATQ
jgi:hypothetical protein